MKLTIFYSWQSDLPNNSNRSFIETALERAVKGILTDSQMEIAPVLDRDTKGIPGSPEIASTIFQKISNSHIFVGDITIINHRAKKPTPNPNVLIELGYALHVLGDAKIILIQNTAFGRPDLLPFDLKMKRVTTYSLNKNGQNKSEERKILIKKIEANLRSIYNIHFKPEEISKAKTAANISEELLHDLEFSDYKDNFISSVDGVRAAQSEYVNLIESVKDVISKTQNERIKFQIINTNDHRSFAINSLNLQLKIYWFCRYSNSLKESYLNIGIFKGGSFNWGEKNIKVTEENYFFNISKNRQHGWAENTDSNKVIASQELAEDLMKRFLKHLTLEYKQRSR